MNKTAQIAIALLLLLWGWRVEAYVDEINPPLEVFSGYKPNYFIMGQPDTKVQLSFKAHLFRQIPIYFAYSQLMIWELFKEGSSPIQDIDFTPEVFYRVGLGPDPMENWLDLGAYEHQSNGKAGDDSRSWDRVYLRWTRTFHTGQETRLHVSLKAWIPFNYDPNNPNIAQYLGIYEGTITLSDFLGSSFERNDLTLRFFPGGSAYINPLKGAQEITFRTKLWARSFLPLAVIQFFHGYGEDLLNYQSNTIAIRAGLGF